MLVRAYSAATKVLAESETQFNAPPKLRIDLLIGGKTYLGPSE